MNIAAESVHRRLLEVSRIEFETFYAGTYERVFATTLLACGSRDLAADATQEAFKRAYARWTRLSREVWVAGWVITTALNYCKKHGRMVRAERELAEDPAIAPPESYLLRARDLDLLGSIQKLPFRQRQALVLFYLEDIPLSKVADLMNLSEGTVKAHLAQARQKLRDSREISDERRT